MVATSNEGKLREIREALARLDIELLSAKDVGVTSFPTENGGSYEENALLKAGYAAIESGLLALADDSGLEVAALNGAPGIFSARFGGNLSDGERLAFLLQEMRDVPKAARGANFTCCLVIAAPSGEVKPFYGESRGKILQGPRGENGFGYDPIFFSHELGKSFAEAAGDEKQLVSHRGKAIREFLEWVLTPQGKSTIAEQGAGRSETS